MGYGPLFIVCRSLSFSDYPVSPLWAFSLRLRALLVYACGPFLFMPTGYVFYACGPFCLCLRALSFMPAGPHLLLLLYMLYCRLAIDMLSLLSRNTA